MTMISKERDLSAGPRSLTVVVPVYNEQEVLPEFHSRMTNALKPLSWDWSLIYVNDGSTDRTMEALVRIRDLEPRVCIIDLSRNFGKEIALTAGLDHATGDAVAVIDADLQDPPELIPELLETLTRGFDVVYAQRTTREGESAIKKVTSHAFYRLVRRLTRVRIPRDTGDFRVMSQRFVRSLGELRERNRFMKGLFAWVGYKQVAVRYRRHPRFAGSTKWNYWKLWNFAIEGITSFSTVPLRVATYVGVAIAAGALVYAVRIVYKTLVYGDPVAGYPSLMTVVLFLGGTQLMTIGVLGEYVGRMFDETKGRPLYFIQGYYPLGRPSGGAFTAPRQQHGRGGG